MQMRCSTSRTGILTTNFLCKCIPYIANVGLLLEQNREGESWPIWRTAQLDELLSIISAGLEGSEKEVGCAHP